MLNKLIKIDLRYILKFMPIFFGAGFLFALISLIFSKLNDSAIFTVISDISKNFALSAAISGVVNIVTRAVATFYKKLYGDESYLTHTLPLSKKTIYFSKILATLYSALIAVSIAIIILVINYNLFENFDAFKTFVEASVGATGGSAVEFIILLILLGFFEVFMLISIVFLAMIEKNRRNKAETVLISLGAYFASSTAFILVIFLVGLFNPEVLELFKNSEAVSVETMKIIFYSGIGVYLLSSIILNRVNIKLLEKGVNVA